MIFFFSHGFLFILFGQPLLTQKRKSSEIPAFKFQALNEKLKRAVSQNFLQHYNGIYPASNRPIYGNPTQSWNVDSGFRVLESGFLVSGTWIPDSNCS